MSFKSKVYNTCIRQLEDKILYLQMELNGLTEGAENDSKSSAGDKHETSRAMMQIEYEKLSNQLNDTLAQKAFMEQIDMKINSTVVETGSLLKTNNGHLFTSIALGKINVDGTEVITLSMQSPLGQKLSGLKAGDAAEINGTRYLIEEVL